MTFSGCRVLEVYLGVQIEDGKISRDRSGTYIAVINMSMGPLNRSGGTKLPEMCAISRKITNSLFRK